MTYLQHDLIKIMISGKYYLASRRAYSGRPGFMLYTGNAIPKKWFSEKTVKKSVWNSLKKDSHGRLTLNLNRVKQLHGKSLLKKLYKQHINGKKISI